MPMNKIHYFDFLTFIYKKKLFQLNIFVGVVSLCIGIPNNTISDFLTIISFTFSYFLHDIYCYATYFKQVSNN